MFACVTGSFSGVFLFFFACLPVEWKNGKLKWTLFLTHRWFLAGVFLDVVAGLHARPPSSVTGHLSFNQRRQEQILVEVKYGHICSKHVQISSIFWHTCAFTSLPSTSISLPSLPHSSSLSSGLMVSTWSTYKGSRASSSSVKQRRQRGNGWSSLTWPCEYGSPLLPPSRGRQPFTVYYELN